MPRSVLTVENIRFIKKNRFKMSGTDMAEHFGVGKNVVNIYMRRNGLALPKELQLKLRGAAISKRYSKIKHPADAIIKRRYLTTPEKKLASILGRSDTYVRGRMAKLGLIVPREIIEQRKADSRIKPGHTPLNKGKKQSEYMSAEAIERTKSTRFKKGQLPSNTKDRDGVIVIRHDHPHRNSGNRKLKFIRISLGKWQMYHQYKWEKKNGKVPAGHCLWFKDGDSLNCKLQNIELITRKENYLRNSASQNLTDRYVAYTIAGRGRTDLIPDIIDEAGMIKVKRQQIILKRKIKNHA
jgi:hypothetical protein